MHDLAVVALAVDEEFELGFGEGEIAVAVDGVEGVERVAAEEPAEAGAGGVAGGVVAGDEGGFVFPGLSIETVFADSGRPQSQGLQPGIHRPGSARTRVGPVRALWPGDGFGLELLDGDDGPLEGFVQGLVGGVDGDGVGEEFSSSSRRGLCRGRGWRR